MEYKALSKELFDIAYNQLTSIERNQFDKGLDFFEINIPQYLQGLQMMFEQLTPSDSISIDVTNPSVMEVFIGDDEDDAQYTTTENKIVDNFLIVQSTIAYLQFLYFKKSEPDMFVPFGEWYISFIDDLIGRLPYELPKSILKRRDDVVKLLNKEKSENVNTKNKTLTSNLYYWQDTLEKLDVFYNLLLSFSLIESNDNYKVLFTNHNVDGDNRIVWKGSQTQLIYLIYVLYGDPYHDISIQSLIIRLFKRRGKKSEFNPKDLRTAFLDIKDKMEDEDSIPKTFSKINEIISAVGMPI